MDTPCLPHTTDVTVGCAATARLSTGSPLSVIGTSLLEAKAASTRGAAATHAHPHGARSRASESQSHGHPAE